MTSIRIDQQGGGPVLEALQQLAGLGADLGPTMAGIARILESRVGMGFRQGRSPYGEAWAPINYRQGQPLRDTGQLQRSITSAHGPDFAQVGTNTEYAPVHQFGLAQTVMVPAHEKTITQAFGKKIPPTTVKVKAHTRQANVAARPFFPIRGGEVDLPADWEESILAQITKAIEGVTNG